MKNTKNETSSKSTAVKALSPAEIKAQLKAARAEAKALRETLKNTKETRKAERTARVANRKNTKAEIKLIRRERNAAVAKIRYEYNTKIKNLVKERGITPNKRGPRKAKTVTPAVENPAPVAPVSE
jgi:uncharacterized protein involved in exopolysaccharide biosynthesis